MGFRDGDKYFYRNGSAYIAGGGYGGGLTAYTLNTRPWTQHKPRLVTRLNYLLLGLA